MSAWTRELAGAYGRSADAWAVGPGRIYDVLADVLVAGSPVALSGSTVLDVGAGRGAASRAIERAGGHALAVDLAEEMVASARRAGGPAGAVADATALPVASAGVDGVVAACSYNHLTDPVAALAEAARVTRPGGVVLASAYALDDDHPVKSAVEAAASAAGWDQPAWINDLKRDAVPLLATVERAMAAGRDAGLAQPTAARVEVPFGHLTPADLVEWRLGMAQMAPFVAGLAADDRAALAADALARLGADPPPLVRPMIALAAVVS